MPLQTPSPLSDKLRAQDPVLRSTEVEGIYSHRLATPARDIGVRAVLKDAISAPCTIDSVASHRQTVLLSLCLALRRTVTMVFEKLLDPSVARAVAAHTSLRLDRLEAVVAPVSYAAHQRMPLLFRYLDTVSTVVVL
jgi:hypothetical protein